MSRVSHLKQRLPDARGGRIVLLSHCLLNENVRFLGGAGRPAAVREIVDDYLDDGIGIYQMPCPEQRVWGGVLKRRMLLAYGAGGTWRGPVSRLLMKPFLAYTRLAYARLARRVARDALDYQRSGFEVVGAVGVGCSPSCGVHTTLDMTGAVDVLTRCPLARLDRRIVVVDAVAANACPGEGMFVHALRKELTATGLSLPFDEHDLLAELADG
jgi:predicted secreted protein